MQPIFFQKCHFAFIFHFPSGTDFQLIYRGVLSSSVSSSENASIPETVEMCRSMQLLSFADRNVGFFAAEMTLIASHVI